MSERVTGSSTDERPIVTLGTKLVSEFIPAFFVSAVLSDALCVPAAGLMVHSTSTKTLSPNLLCKVCTSIKI
jgi:hypothetical protein